MRIQRDIERTHFMHSDIYVTVYVDILCIVAPICKANVDVNVNKCAYVVVLTVDGSIVFLLALSIHSTQLDLYMYVDRTFELNGLSMSDARPLFLNKEIEFLCALCFVQKSTAIC